MTRYLPLVDVCWITRKSTSVPEPPDPQLQPIGWLDDGG